MSQDNVSFWTNRWNLAETGWHLSQLNPALQKHGEAFFGTDSTSILFPLCGKSLDMKILSSKYKVAGIEGVQQALDQFAAENNSELVKTTTDINNYDKFTMDITENDQTSTVDIYFGDFFAMKPEGEKVQFDRVFDRGSLVAILPKLREQYMQIINSLLKPGGKWMVASMCYDQTEMPGPPHSIGPDDIKFLLEQLEANVPSCKYSFEVVEVVDALSAPQRSRFLTVNGGPLANFQDYTIIITKIQ
jgi:thiopurine S-methyltransferase